MNKQDFVAAAANGDHPTMPRGLSVAEKMEWAREATAAYRSNRQRLPKREAPPSTRPKQILTAQQRRDLAAYHKISSTLARGDKWISCYITKLGRHWLVELPALGSRMFTTKREAKEWIWQAPEIIREGRLQGVEIFS